ncbi:hypothetical protein HPO96_36565 [Kribbella sandramycini]|uniref:Uncharacterized protein n=1 Tax=Kribbella sandramycini TaxID=60450 RepID=A0A7Y4L7F6_9ACTN|nr:hypothetical protein [Kribbella sandramycini]MBB6567236.1 hypothetical protein [Kribbella sandramycini]NOL45773.1 hypothetical protein [Kribbella sandramycini]
MDIESYGTQWRATLLRADRPSDCLFRLTLLVDPSRGAEGVVFTEFYDYAPLGTDPGREYGYSVNAPYDALDVLADAYSPGDGPARERLADGLATLVMQGVLGNNLPLKGNQAKVLEGFLAAGVTATKSNWFWMNSD